MGRFRESDLKEMAWKCTELNQPELVLVEKGHTCPRDKLVTRPGCTLPLTL